MQYNISWSYNVKYHIKYHILMVFFYQVSLKNMKYDFETRLKLLMECWMVLFHQNCGETLCLFKIKVDADVWFE